jgi:hypothetical protein
MMKKTALLLVFIATINYSSFAQVCSKDDIMARAWHVVGDTNLTSTFTVPNRGREATNWEDVWNGKYLTDYSYTLLDNPLNLVGEELKVVKRLFSGNFKDFDKNSVVVKVQHIEDDEFFITTFIGFIPNPNGRSCHYIGVSNSTVSEVDNNKMKTIKHLQEQRDFGSDSITQPDASHLSRSYDYDTKKYGFKDKDNKNIASFDYDMAWSFSENLAAVKKNGFWGYINAKGETIIPFKYDRVWSFINGEARVESNGKWYFIDQNGKCSFNCE